jgi:High potential iron-sulfur protein
MNTSLKGKVPLLSRRMCLGATLGFSLGGTLLAAVAGCQKRGLLVCGDPSHLSDAENSLRTSLHYTEESTRSNQVCAGCGFFDGSSRDACGTCKLLKGPVSPKGHCDSWNAIKA